MSNVRSPTASYYAQDAVPWDSSTQTRYEYDHGTTWYDGRNVGTVTDEVGYISFTNTRGHKRSREVAAPLQNNAKHLYSADRTVT